MLDDGPAGLEILAEQLPSSRPLSTACRYPVLVLVWSMEYGYGQVPLLSSSSMLPVKVMVYNDLAMDTGTAQ